MDIPTEPQAPQTIEAAPQPVQVEAPVDAVKPPTAILEAAYALMRARYRSLIGLILISTLATVLSAIDSARQAAEDAATSLHQLGSFAFSSTALLASGVSHLTAAVSETSETSTVLGIGFIIAIVVFIVCLMYISVSISLGLMYGFSGQEAPTSWKAFRTGMKFAGSFVWVSFLTGLVVLAGLFLLIIPGIYWGVLYGLAIWALIIEGVRGPAALTRSKALVKGRWWTVAYRMGMLSLFSFLLYIVVGIMSGIIGVTVSILAGAVVRGLVAGLFIEPLSLCYFIVLYRELMRTRPLVS